MKVFRTLCIVILAVAWCGIANAQAPFTAGTWTKLTNAPSTAVGHIMLLTDGSILAIANTCNTVGSWYRLVPDSTGSYINGTWTNAGNLPGSYNPLYFASSVLPGGQVVVMGGEYNACGAVWTTLGALYNPKSNSWTSLAAPTGWSTIGDAQSVILPNGHMMIANCCTTQEAILTLSGSTPTWTTTGTGKFDENDEEGWTMLPGGKLLTVDAYVGSTCCKMGYQLYDPTTGAWTTPANNTVVNLVGSGSELGPMLLLPNGTVFAAGGSTSNAVYTVSTGTWASAPKFGGSLDVTDGPGAVLPDGNALLDAAPGLFGAGSKFFEWDGTALNAVPGVPNAASDPSYYGNMVVLPTGQILFTDFSSDVEVYTPVGGPCAGCAPTVKSVATTLTHGSNNNRIGGTQFNGLTQGGYYGDDSQNASNFPLVRITDSTGKVVYCRTHGWGGGVATGSTLVTAKFDIPATIATGAATLEVVANGIASAPVAVTIN